MTQAKTADDGTRAKFQASAGAFTLLGKTRAELTAMMPQSNTASADNNPAVAALREAMKGLDAVKGEKEATMA